MQTRASWTVDRGGSTQTIELLQGDLTDQYENCREDDQAKLLAACRALSVLS